MLFLTADAFGVLPPVSILDDAATQYHFLSGFTAKMAGMERGMTEHQPTFQPVLGGIPVTSPDHLCRGVTSGCVMPGPKPISLTLAGTGKAHAFHSKYSGAD